MKILVINCGSSSLKYQLIDSNTEEALASGICDRIGIDGELKYQPAGCEKNVTKVAIPNHEVAVKLLLEALTNEKNGVIKSLDEIQAVGHRVVHGGEKFSSSVIIDEEVLTQIEECVELAPIHNPSNIVGIKVIQNIMPGVPNVGVFDTAFHQTMPKKAYMYGLPLKYYDKYKIRRYGFHGTSHSFVSKRACEFCGLDPKNSKIIVCHLGGGASISAVLNGESIDTSMGLTPLEGMVMGTRCGNIDATIVEFLMSKENMTIEQVMDILNKKSGVLGITNGFSSDFRDLNDAAEAGDELADLAMEAFSYSAAKYIGGYIMSMHGVDAIVFTAGIGENDHIVRDKITSYFDYLGVEINPEVSKSRGKEVMLSTPDSKVKVCVIPTNEELAIARETVILVNNI
ncbi:MAG: acetate kinase [Lachnospiraceae bacterium]|nr:acetate kinase [Lachnospiraceae bacterium]